MVWLQYLLSMVFTHSELKGENDDNGISVKYYVFNVFIQTTHRIEDNSF